jgi:hypothetical protein
MEDFRPSEKRQLRALHTPAKIQSYLDRIPYHLAGTAYSPRMVLAEKTAHCLEGAIFAAAALRVNGHPPLLLDLEGERDSDHVIAPFRVEGAWGAIAISNFTGLRYREPVYRTLRELALSYFNDYFNLRRQRSLRTFSKAVNLQQFDAKNWMTRTDHVWFIAEHLCDIPHSRLLTPRMEKNLGLVDARALKAGTMGMRRKTVRG